MNEEICVGGGGTGFGVARAARFVSVCFFLCGVTGQRWGIFCCKVNEWRAVLVATLSAFRLLAEHASANLSGGENEPKDL